MKKLISTLLVLALLLASLSVAVAEYTDRETVKMVQQALNDAGYDCGTPDGIAGKNTKNAIIAYQQANGLEETGVVDDALLESLGISVETEAEAEAEAAVADAEAAESEGLAVDGKIDPEDFKGYFNSILQYLSSMSDYDPQFFIVNNALLAGEFGETDENGTAVWIGQGQEGIAGSVELYGTVEDGKFTHVSEMRYRCPDYVEESTLNRDALICTYTLIAASPELMNLTEDDTGNMISALNAAIDDGSATSFDMTLLEHWVYLPGSKHGEALLYQADGCYAAYVCKYAGEGDYDIYVTIREGEYTAPDPEEEGEYVEEEEDPWTELEGNDVPAIADILPGCPITLPESAEEFNAVFDPEQMPLPEGMDFPAIINALITEGTYTGSTPDGLKSLDIRTSVKSEEEGDYSWLSIGQVELNDDGTFTYSLEDPASLNPDEVESFIVYADFESESYRHHYFCEYHLGEDDFAYSAIMQYAIDTDIEYPEWDGEGEYPEPEFMGFYVGNTIDIDESALSDFFSISYDCYSRSDNEGVRIVELYAIPADHPNVYMWTRDYDLEGNPIEGSDRFSTDDSAFSAG